MKKAGRVTAAALMLLLAAATLAGAQEPGKDPTTAYVFSILLGFGTGHYYLQDSAGLRFLLLEAGALVVFAVGLGLALASFYTMDPANLGFPPGYVAGLGIGIFGALAFGGFRIWEIVDVISKVNARQTSGEAAGKVTMRPVFAAPRLRAGPAQRANPPVDAPIQPSGAYVGVALSY